MASMMGRRLQKFSEELRFKYLRNMFLVMGQYGFGHNMQTVTVVTLIVHILLVPADASTTLKVVVFLPMYVAAIFVFLHINRDRSSKMLLGKYLGLPVVVAVVTELRGFGSEGVFYCRLDLHGVLKVSSYGSDPEKDLTMYQDGTVRDDDFSVIMENWRFVQ